MWKKSIYNLDVNELDMFLSSSPYHEIFYSSFLYSLSSFLFFCDILMSNWEWRKSSQNTIGWILFTIRVGIFAITSFPWRLESITSSSSSLLSLSLTKEEQMYLLPCNSMTALWWTTTGNELIRKSKFRKRENWNDFSFHIQHNFLLHFLFTSVYLSIYHGHVRVVGGILSVIRGLKTSGYGKCLDSRWWNWPLLEHTVWK